MGRSARRSQATPHPKRFFQRRTRLLSERVARLETGSRALAWYTLRGSGGYLAGLLGARGLRLALNTAVAVLVVSLPFAATSASRANAVAPGAVLAATAVSFDTPRAQPVARGQIAASRNPLTVLAEGARPIQHVTIGPGDTLEEMANKYDVSSAAIAFANGITDPRALRPGQVLQIPPAEGALYTVKDGDTVDAVASRFKVDAAVIKDYNRLYFEPEHFAPGQLIFVRGAELPSLEAERPARAAVAVATGPQLPQPARTGKLAWPVGGRITQFFWWGHTGVDVGAPYGTGIGASDDGVVSATGWVPVGGLRVCLQHSGDLVTCYYHTSAVSVQVGEHVARGQIIATVGLTGVTTGPHVHWECRLGTQFVNCLSL